jgi:hypothetical protein
MTETDKADAQYSWVLKVVSHPLSQFHES